MALFIDMIILLSLAGTLGYAFLVDRKLRSLMEALRTLEPVVGQFSEAVDRTESSVRSLQADEAARATKTRGDEPPLSRSMSTTSAWNALAAAGRSAPDQHAQTARQTPTQPAQLPPGVERVTGKSDLVMGFFETIRSREA